ncbi:MAG TPA: hypothetical protein VN229_12415 [Terriglobales bacterium]|nr:hypothetical protein [Terriglobales bacterium]
MTVASTGKDGRVRNPKLKAFMLATLIAVVVNAVLVAYAPLLINCGATCDPAQQNGIAGYMIHIGLKFPRVVAYSHFQVASGFSYPWSALAFVYGILSFEYLIGIVITWTVIVLDSLEWSRTYDFAQMPKKSDATHRIIGAILIVLVLTVWGMALNPYFTADRHFSHRPAFSTNMAPAIEFPAVYAFSSMLFGLGLRLSVYYLRRRKQRHADLL